MNRILITGITGFAGSHLAELLVQDNGSEIYGTHLSDRHLNNLSAINNKIKLYKINLLDSTETANVIKSVQPQVIFHLAASTSVAESFKKPAEVLMNNITSEVNIFEALKREEMLTTKVIVIASSHVYGYVSTQDLPISETVQFQPDNPYAVSKIAQDYLAFSYYLSYKIPVIRLRPFNHIGPRLSPEISVSRFAKSIADIEKGLQEPILRVGNLTTKRDFTDVRDMVKAYTLAAEHCIPGEAYNIGTGISYTMTDILQKLLHLSSKDIKLESEQSLYRPSDIPELRCNATKFKNATGWIPNVPLEKTLQDTLDYWRNQP